MVRASLTPPAFSLIINPVIYPAGPVSAPKGRMPTLSQDRMKTPGAAASPYSGRKNADGASPAPRTAAFTRPYSAGQQKAVNYKIQQEDNMWISDHWNDYEVIDCSKGEKLERWGDFLLVRPDPQAPAVDRPL